MNLIAAVNPVPASLDTRAVRRKHHESEAIKHFTRGLGEIELGLSHVQAIYDGGLYDGKWKDYCREVFGRTSEHWRRLANFEHLQAILDTNGVSIPGLNESTAREIPARFTDEQRLLVVSMAQTTAVALNEDVSPAIVKKTVTVLTEYGVTGQWFNDGDTQSNAQAAIINELVEARKRQLQHIADNSNWDKVATIECDPNWAAQRIAALMQERKAELSGKRIKVVFMVEKDKPADAKST